MNFTKRGEGLVPDDLGSGCAAFALTIALGLLGAITGLLLGAVLVVVSNWARDPMLLYFIGPIVGTAVAVTLVKLMFSIAGRL